MSSTSTATRENQYLSPLAFVAKYWKFLLISVIFGALAGVVFSFVLQPRWTAKMTVQIGQVAPANLVESQLTTVERFGLSSFKFAVLKALGLPLPNTQNADSMLLFDSLRAAPSKSPDLVNVQASGYSPESAAKTLRAALDELSKEHDKSFSPTIERMNAELKETDDKIADTRKEYAASYGELKRTTTQNNALPASHDVFLANLVATISVEARALTTRKSQLEEALAPLRTYPTRALGDIYVADRPSTPGKFLLGAGGAFIGLIAGVLIALFWNMRQR